jgi:type IV pilus assembly protein PilW
MTLTRPALQPSRQRGFTMIELMVAVLIGLFLMVGLIGLLQSNRRAFYSQSALAQLQDSERLATTMMNDVIEQAGYFPDPTTNTALSAFAASGSFAQSQTIYGTYSASAPGDTISVRYTTTGGDGVINCSGGSNPTGGGLTTYTMTFSVVKNATTNVWQLVCTMGGTVYQLVNNVTNLSVMYGVNTSGSGSNVDTYMNASAVTANLDWNNVVSVYITLTFNIGLTGPGQPTIAGQVSTKQISRTISIMSQTG